MASNRIDNFNLTNIGLEKGWYDTAAGSEAETTWGQLPQFKGDVQHIKLNRVLMAWFDSELDDMVIRRNSGFAIARRLIQREDIPDNVLESFWSLFGTESVMPRLADNICTLYNDAPERTFSADKLTQEAFTELYDSFDVNGAVQMAYKKALFTNCVVLLPDWKEQRILVLTPDYFRLVGRDELWLVYRDYSKNFNGEIKYKVWTPETVKVVDAKGIKEKEEENPYKRIPATILKLNRSADLYGSGISEAVDVCAWSSLMRMLSSRIGLFQSFSVAVATNFEIDEKTHIGPGHILIGKNPTGEPGSVPKLEYISPEGKFAELEKYRQGVIDKLVRGQGLPPFLVDEGAGQPPTGAALQVMERELNEKRKQHRYSLTNAELDLVDLFSVLAAVEVDPVLGTIRPNLNTLGENGKSVFSIQYADVETFNDPAFELKHDTELASQGLLSPIAFVFKYTGQRMESDEAAYKLMADNKQFFQSAGELKSTVGGSQSLQALVIAYEAGQVQRGAAVSMAVNVFGFSPEVAESFFVIKTEVSPKQNAL